MCTITSNSAWSPEFGIFLKNWKLQINSESQDNQTLYWYPFIAYIVVKAKRIESRITWRLNAENSTANNDRDGEFFEERACRKLGPRADLS